MSVMGREHLCGLRGSFTNPGRTLTGEGGLRATQAQGTGVRVRRRPSRAGGGVGVGAARLAWNFPTPGLLAGSETDKGTSRVRRRADKVSEVTRGQGGLRGEEVTHTGLTLTPRPTVFRCPLLAALVVA